MTVEENKAIVKMFYDLAFNRCRPADAVDLYAVNKYVDLNPRCIGGKGLFVEYFDRLARDHPGKHVEFRHVIGEKDFVVLHCLYRWANDPDSEGFDIFRVDDDGKIVQHWGVIDRVPEGSPPANVVS